MNRTEKTTYISSLKKDLENNNAMMVYHYEGLNVTQLDELNMTEPILRCWLGFKSLEHVHRIQPDFSDIVSALHDEQGRNTQSTDEFTRCQVIRRRQFEETDGVMLERIYPKGNHQIPGFKFADVIQGVGQGLAPLTERRCGRKSGVGGRQVIADRIVRNLSHLIGNSFSHFIIAISDIDAPKTTDSVHEAIAV